MKQIPSLLTAMLMLASVWALPSAAFSADKVMPRPDSAVGYDLPDQPEAGSTADDSNDLNDALSTKVPKGVEVRTYVSNDGAKITEYSRNGRVYMMHVQPVGGAPGYDLYDESGKGVFERRLPSGYKHISPPMWTIKEY